MNRPSFVCTWVLLGLVAFAVCVVLVPVQNTAHKGGDEGDLGFSTGHRLGEGEEQRHVAVNPMLVLQLPVQQTQLHLRSSRTNRLAHYSEEATLLISKTKTTYQPSQGQKGIHMHIYSYLCTGKKKKKKTN